MKKQESGMDSRFLNPDEPEFTAKAIGETQWGRPEALVEPTHQDNYDALAQFAALLETELHPVGEADTLRSDQIQTIRNQVKRTKTRHQTVVSFPGLYWLGGIAAAVLLMVLVPLSNQLWWATVDRSGVEREAVNEVEFMLPPPPLPSALPRAAEGNGAVLLSKDFETGIEPGVSGSAPDEMGRLRAIAERETYAGAWTVDESSAKRLDAKPVPTLSLSASDVTKSQSANLLSAPAARLKSVEATAPETPILTVSEKKKLLNSVLHEPDEAMTLQGYGEIPTREEDADGVSREGYAWFEDHAFQRVKDEPLSTFSIDVDTASYSNVRRFLKQGMIPPAGAVRVEELLNYFNYPSYAEIGAAQDSPIGVNLQSIPAPWNPSHMLVRAAVKADKIAEQDRPDANLVFLVDVSGSMNHPGKLPLVKYSLKTLAMQMDARDRIAVVVYAGSSGVVLPSTTANNSETIAHALDHLEAGGSTHGEAGLELAYDVAQKHYIAGGINRVILCTDGDFNVGLSSDDALVSLIEEKRESGVFFTVLGYGVGNYQDAKMELLSNHGNGNFAYIDSEAEARKQLSCNLLGMLKCVAKDVKIQVEFNPAAVQAYRLIGYENRLLAKQDFNDDRKDAGEMGAGQTVTALYEIVPVGLAYNETFPVPEVDPLKYQSVGTAATDVALDVEGEKDANREIMTLKVRYKRPDDSESRKFEVAFTPGEDVFSDAARSDLQFAAAVAAYGMKLRSDGSVATFPWDAVLSLARASLGDDPDSGRAEFLDLISQAATLSSQLERQ